MTQNTVNERQVGGSHYSKGGSFQHWDIIEENEIGYLEGCATKYIARYRDKNGAEDLRKSEHYVQKLIEMNGSVGRSPRGWAPQDHIDLFCAHYNMDSRQKTCMELLLGTWTVPDLNHVQDLLAVMIEDWERRSGNEEEKTL